MTGPMNLVLTANWPYRKVALNLIESYRQNGGSGKVLYCPFGPFEKSHIDVVRSHYEGQVEFREVERMCPHAHEPGLQYFKAFALAAALDWKEPFLYLDVLEEIRSWPVAVEKALEREGRFFMSYPPDPFYRNDKWTTNECFRRMGCDETRFRAAPQHWSAVLAFAPTTDNEGFLSEMHEFMKDPLIAGPAMRIDRPDGQDGCMAHRSDQSVFSLLVVKAGWTQAFDPALFAAYGDTTTLEGWTPAWMKDLPEMGTVIMPRPCPRDLERAPLVPESLLRSAG